MAYYSPTELESLGFKGLGKSVLVSTKCSIYTPESVVLGDHSRGDDFAMLAGNVEIGRNVHITAYCNVEGGRAGVNIGDFSTLAYGCHVIAQSDDYSGRTMTNSTIPARFKNEDSRAVRLGKHVILGTGTIVLPGVELPDGVAAGAGTLFTKSVEAWGLYVGSPAKRVKERSRALLALTEEFLSTEG